MIIIGYEDLVLLIAMFLVVMVLLVVTTAVTVYKIIRFRFAPPQMLFPQTDPEEYKSFISRP